MIEFARTVPNAWNDHVELGRTIKGRAVHALNLDIDVGPLLQTQKLLDSVIFARRKGHEKPLSAAELELMNLTGDGNGFDMVIMPVSMRDRVPTANFFQRSGYERNPVASRHNVVSKLLAAIDAKHGQGDQAAGREGKWRLRSRVGSCRRPAWPSVYLDCIISREESHVAHSCSARNRRLRFLPREARAEAKTLRVAKQFGVAYMQFMVMEDQKMIEKHAKAAGLGDITVELGNQFRSSDVMNDALISGSVDFVCLGIPGIITIWSKTKGTSLDVKAVDRPQRLAADADGARSGDQVDASDFKDHHKIAMPAVKVSMQAIMLQMAAAKEFGDRRNSTRSTISRCRWRIRTRPPPCSAAPSEIVANFSSAPFQYRQMKNPNIRRILTSTDLFDGGLSFNVIADDLEIPQREPEALRARSRRRCKEATDFINADKKRAAEIYLKVTEGQDAGRRTSWRCWPTRRSSTRPRSSGIKAFVSLHGQDRHAEEPAGRLDGHVLPRGAAPDAGG